MRVRLFSAEPTALLARHAACTLALGAWLASAPARAADAPSIELTWSGPGPEATCIGGEGLTRAVNEYLGRTAISSPPAELQLSVSVERQKTGWRAWIRLSDQRAQAQLGERELVSEDPLCSGLDEALKLSVALLVDSELVDVAPASSRTPAKEPPSAPAPPEQDKATPEPSESPEEPTLFAKRPWQFALELSMLAAGGVLPSAAGGLELGFDASPTDWLSLRAHGVAFVPQTLSPGPSAEVKAAAFYGGAAVCPRSTLHAGLTLMGCFGMEAGRLSVSRTGLQGGNDSAHRLLMGSVGARLTLALSPKWGVVGQLSALLPLQQDRFLVDVDGNPRELFEVSVVPWVAGLGGSFMF